MNHRLFGPMKRVLQYPDLQLRLLPVYPADPAETSSRESYSKTQVEPCSLHTQDFGQVLFDCLQNLVRYPDTLILSSTPVPNRPPVSGDRFN
jgi:hypothetical protein